MYHRPRQERRTGRKGSGASTLPVTPVNNVNTVDTVTPLPSPLPLWLFELVDDLRKRRDAELIVEPPAPGLGVRMRALEASTVEALCAELHLPVPEWCWETAALPDPWFVAGLDDLKVMALVESPVWFRRRNVFVPGNFLSRA